MAPSEPEATEAPAGAQRALPSPGSGSLTEHPLPRLLLDVYRLRFTGALALTRNKTHKRIVFQDGAPVSSESNLNSETLGIQLVDQGLLSQENHARISAYMQKEQCREGVALLALELLEPKGLFLALKEQVRRRLLEAFAWASGDFQFEQGDELKKEVQSFRSDPYLLVREGIVNHWTPDRVLQDLTAQMGQYAAPGAGFEEAARRLVSDDTSALFGHIDGSSNLGQAIGSGFSNPGLLATVWILANAGLLRFSDTPHVADDDALEIEAEPEIEIEVLSWDAGALREPAATSEAENAGPSAADSDAAEVMRNEVMSRVERLSELNFYELLEVPENATAGDIRKAYFKEAKRYHPDALARLGLGEIKEQAAIVFGRIAEANDVLKDASKRKEYDAALNDHEPEIDVNALAQAETFYRKGEILMRMGDFKGALEFFQPAVDVWPDESTYQSALGWALYKQPKSNAEKATEHLQLAIDLDDSDAIAHFRLSVIQRALGDEDAAATSMARAKMLDPKLEG